jgi:aquaporin Z
VSGAVVSVPRVGRRRLPALSPYAAEFLGTGIMLVVGLSAVSVDFGAGSFVATTVPSALVRRLITGTIFAGGATLVVYSVLGRVSGGHLNPAVTLTFLGLGKIHGRLALGYIAAQTAGAIVAAAAVSLLLGRLATSVSDGATVPGPQGPLAAVVAEALMTFALVEVILEFMRRPALARFTPLAAGILVAFLVTVEAPLSGTSLNPARSLGPALVAGVFTDFWVYLAGPIAGAAAAVAVAGRASAALVPCAKLFHTDEFACHFHACVYEGRGPRPHQEHAAEPQEATS